jgi:hypothetical protein
MTMTTTRSPSPRPSLRSSLCATLFALTLCGSLGPAHARSIKLVPDAAFGSLDRSAMRTEMKRYFFGEKWQGPFFMGTGAAGLVIGSSLAAQDSDFMRGTGYPMIAVGALQALVGAIIFFRTDAQLARLERLLDQNPTELRARELSRIRRINLQFELLAATESLLLVGGAITATAGAARRNDLLKGVGLGLVIESVATLALDLVAAQRALRYTSSLTRFDVGLLGSAAGGSTTGAVLQASGVF